MKTYRFNVTVQSARLSAFTTHDVDFAIRSQWSNTVTDVAVTELADTPAPELAIPDASVIVQLETELDAMARIIAHQNSNNIRAVAGVDEATALCIQQRIAKATGGGK